MADVPPKNDSVPNGRTDRNNEAKQETDERTGVINWNGYEKETLTLIIFKMNECPQYK